LHLAAQGYALSGGLKPALPCGAKRDIKIIKRKNVFFKQLSGTAFLSRRSAANGGWDFYQGFIFYVFNS